MTENDHIGPRSTVVMATILKLFPNIQQLTRNNFEKETKR